MGLKNFDIISNNSQYVIAPKKDSSEMSLVQLLLIEEQRKAYEKNNNKVLFIQKPVLSKDDFSTPYVKIYAEKTFTYIPPEIDYFPKKKKTKF